MSELRSGDEIPISQTIEVIKKETKKLKYYDDNDLEKIVKDVVIYIPEFEYVRLARAIRINEIEIDMLMQRLNQYFQKE